MATKVSGVNPLLTHTSAQHPVGLVCDDPRPGFVGNRIKYVKAGSTIAVGDACYVDVTDATYEPGTVIPTSAVNQPVDGVAHVAIASASFGFITIAGRVPSGKVAAGTAAGGQLGSSATAGTLSTMVVTTPTAAETSRILAAASGRAVTALDAESSGTAELYIY